MRIIIIGSGGHAQVVADALLAQQRAGNNVSLVGFLDDDSQRQSESVLGYPVLGPLSSVARWPHDAVVVAVGDNATRCRIYQQLVAQGETLATVIHPAALVAPDAAIGAGTVICARVVVNTGSVVGENVILNTGCTVDHHNRIASHAHIAPGANLAGGVRVGEGGFIGIGAVIIPGCSVGEWATIGAGAVVTKDIPARVVAVGAPARVIRRLG